MEVSCILAGYNEEKNVISAVKQCVDAMEDAFDDYEIILVDDGSKDSTAAIMAELAKANSRIRFLPNLINLNFGISVLRGLLAAKHEYVIFNAMDLPLNPKLYKEILLDMPSCDLMVLERRGYKPSAGRAVTSALNQLFLHVLFPLYMRGNPVVNFVQVFRRDKLAQILPLARSPIFVWPEMIFRAKQLGLRVQNKKVPVNEGQTRKGAFGNPHDIIWGVYDMLRFRIRKYMGRI